MKVYKITPLPDFNPCTEKDIKDLMIWLEESEPGDSFKVDVLEMTEEEYAALPEYMGP